MYGRIVRLDVLPFTFIPPRPVDVWLPPNYDENGRYPTLYMHDGQNLFFEQESSDGVTWGVDKGMFKLLQAGQIEPAIVVGIWNIGLRRWAEYLPERPYHTLPKDQQEKNAEFFHGHGIQSDNYLKFIVHELKPMIDQQFATNPEQNFLMGSSMGGLISAYGLCEYPHIFQGAACLSTHWVAPKDSMIDYLRDNLPAPGTHKLYFDFGTESLDAHYEPYQIKADAVMNEAGYTQGNDWLTKKFPGAQHHERDWQARIHIPLKFLLG